MKMKLHITQFNLYIKCNLHVKFIYLFIFFNILTSVAHTMTKTVFILVALAKSLTQ